MSSDAHASCLVGQCGGVEEEEREEAEKVLVVGTHDG